MGFKEFFGLCKHEWEEGKTMEIHDNTNDRMIGFKIKMKCKKCGIIKFITNTIWDY